MRKLSLLFMVMMLSMFTFHSKADTVSWDFNDLTSPKQEAMPEGWWLIDNTYAFADLSNDAGVDGSKCINFQAAWYGPEEAATFITKANAGTVSIKVRPNTTSSASFGSSFITIYKMNEGGNSGFTRGEKLIHYAPVGSIPGYSSWRDFMTLTVNLEEDCYIGISGCDCFVDNYVNEFTQGGEDPLEGEWVVSSSETFDAVGANSGDYQFDPKGLPAGWYGLGVITDNEYRGNWKSYTGVDGSPCILLENSMYSTGSASEMSYLVTYARAGKISLMVKAESASYVNDSYKRAYLGLYTVKGEPGSFSIGDQIVFYEGDFRNVPANPTISNEGFSKMEFDIAADGWVAIAINHFYIDNYENLVLKQGGAATTVTDEQDFNSIGSGCGAYNLNVAGLPTGWFGIGAWASNEWIGSWPSDKGVDGTPCIFTSDNDNTHRNYLVTYAHAGKASFMLKPRSSVYVDDARAFLEICKVTGEPGSFEVGQQIAFYDRLSKVPAQPAINADGFSLVEFDVEEDGWIAIATNYAYFDNWRNTYESSSAAGYTVSGTVKDSEGNPLAGVKVALSTCPDTTTAEDGTFSFSDVSGNFLNLVVSAEGYVDYVETFNVDADKTIDVVLERVKSTMVITASDYNISITTAVFSLYDGETPVIENVTANEDGKYVFTLTGALNPDGYTLKGTAPYFNAYECQVKVNDSFSSYPCLMYGESVNRTVYLSEHKLTLVATVLDNEQNYVTNATLSFAYPEDAGVSYVRNAVNNNDGTYTFNEIRASVAADKACIVTCSVPEMKEIEPAAVIFNDENQTVTFTAQPYAPTVITGKVTNATNGEPLANATVMLSEGDDPSAMPEFVEVDNEGNYSFTITKFDTSYTLMASAECYKDATPVIISEINREETITHDFALEPVMYTFTATVTNKASEAIADAIVTLNGKNLDKDEHGNFVASIWAGDAKEVVDYTAVASAEGYSSKEYKFDFLMDENVTYDFVLENAFTYTIAGTLTDAVDGEPIADEGMMLLKDGDEFMNAKTDANGAFTFTVDNADAEYALMPQAAGYDDLTEPVAVPELIPDGTVTVNVKMQPTLYTFTATVKSDAGAPVTEATIILTDENGKEYNVENKNDGTYVYTCAEKNMVFGKYTVAVSCNGFDPFSREIEFTLYAYNVNEDITLTTAGISSLFAGRQGAVNANGKIYVNGNVRIFSVNGMLVRVVSTEEPAEVDLDPGIYVVEGQKMMVK